MKKPIFLAALLFIVIVSIALSSCAPSAMIANGVIEGEMLHVEVGAEQHLYDARLTVTAVTVDEEQYPECENRVGSAVCNIGFLAAFQKYDYRFTIDSTTNPVACRLSGQTVPDDLFTYRTQGCT